jgi:1-aminocyclopropane-1-carboxylate deaminase
MEIGSGMSYLVAKEVFLDSFDLLGILVSESNEQWIQKVPWLQKELGLAILPLDPKQILAVPDLFPENSKQFGKTKQNSKLNIRSYFEKTGILLEPIYSFKSILCMEKLGKKNHLEPTIFKDRCIFYLHQGGQIQHLDSVWDGKKWLTQEFQFGA